MSETATMAPMTIAPVATTVVHAKITKAGNALFSFDYGKVGDEQYRLIVTAGVTALLNTRMTKITKKDVPDEADRHRQAWQIAEENAAALYGGTFKAGRATKTAVTSGASREEMTEAMRLARIAVKDEIRRQGGKLSHYSAADITLAAKGIVEGNPKILEQAKINLANVVRAPVPVTLHEDPKKVKAAEDRAAKAKAEKQAQLSAKQAGMPKPRVEVIKH